MPEHEKFGEVGRVRRWFLLGLGYFSLALGSIGVVVPGLPTTPLVILAAYCFARSSPRMHQRLLAHRVFGPLIVEWNDYRSIPLRAKILAVTMITLFGGLAIFVIPAWWARLGLAAILTSVIAFLVSRPTSPDQRVESHRRNRDG